MTRLQTIERELQAINDAKFQELCDGFLLRKNKNYALYTRLGSVKGKQKTAKGTPDSFLILPSGNFIFVEFTTDESKGLDKIKKDIQKCLAPGKTGVPVENIEEIIFCINFELKSPDSIRQLMELLSETTIKLTIYTLSSLALELSLHHRDLVHTYLNLPLDSGQVVSINRFIQEYNTASGGSATPLDNTFLPRDAELQAIIHSLNSYGLTILSGSPGVGKTRLAIESINEFLTENSAFTTFCISYKGATLLDDLHTHLHGEGHYILFVDDANRIDAFNQIIGFYKSFPKGHLKIVLTVRDYAFESLRILCQDYVPNHIEIDKLSDDEIIELIKSFDILNPDFSSKIVEIADGNPRIAIMAAILAKETNDLNALTDVSQLFENYFNRILQDDDSLNSPEYQKVLGLIAFFYTIPYKDRLSTTAILENFGMDYYSFLQAIDVLDRLEIVELQYDYVKIPEQNLSAFFFYKAFVKESHLSFDTLLQGYFGSNSSRFQECVISANNTFGGEKVMNKLKPDLISFLAASQTNEKLTFDFLKIFWFYLIPETFKILYDKINTYPIVTSPEYKMIDEKSSAESSDLVIDLLGNFFRFSDTLKDSLELSVEYLKRQPGAFTFLVEKIRGRLLFDREDQWERFSRQKELCSFLIGNLDKHQIYKAIFTQIVGNFLGFAFRHSRASRGDTFQFYSYMIPDCEDIRNFRKMVWMAIDDHYLEMPQEFLVMLNNYGPGYEGYSKELYEFDIPFIERIIRKHLDPMSFRHCRLVHNLVRRYRRNNVGSSLYDLLDTFQSKEYKTFVILDWDRLRDKEDFEYDDYHEYEKLKIAEIRKSVKLKDKTSVIEFYQQFDTIRNEVDNIYNLYRSLDIVIDHHLQTNSAIGLLLLDTILENNNDWGFIPTDSFLNFLTSAEQVEQLWKLVTRKDYNLKIRWSLNLLDRIPADLLNESHRDAYLETLEMMSSSQDLVLSSIEKYSLIDADFVLKALRIIVRKTEYASMHVRLWASFFEAHFDKLCMDLELLKKAYLQQHDFDHHFDHGGTLLLKILSADKSFLLHYVKTIFEGSKILSPSASPLGLVWNIADIEQEIERVIEFIAADNSYIGMGDHYCNSFFKSIPSEQTERAKEFLRSVIRSKSDHTEVINIIIDIARHSFPDMFNELLLSYIELNSDIDSFSKIYWRGNGTFTSGNVISGDIEAADWKNIQSIIEQSEAGVRLIPIKGYINDQINRSLRWADLERKRRYTRFR